MPSFGGGVTHRTKFFNIRGLCLPLGTTLAQLLTLSSWTPTFLWHRGPTRTSAARNHMGIPIEIATLSKRRFTGRQCVIGNGQSSPPVILDPPFQQLFNTFNLEEITRTYSRKARKLCSGGRPRARIRIRNADDHGNGGVHHVIEQRGGWVASETLDYCQLSCLRRDRRRWKQLQRPWKRWRASSWTHSRRTSGGRWDIIWLSSLVTGPRMMR